MEEWNFVNSAWALSASFVFILLIWTILSRNILKSVLDRSGFVGIRSGEIKGEFRTTAYLRGTFPASWVFFEQSFLKDSTDSLMTVSSVNHLSQLLHRNLRQTFPSDCLFLLNLFCRKNLRFSIHAVQMIQQFFQLGFWIISSMDLSFIKAQLNNFYCTVVYFSTEVPSGYKSWQHYTNDRWLWKQLFHLPPTLFHKTYGDVFPLEQKIKCFSFHKDEMRNSRNLKEILIRSWKLKKLRIKKTLIKIKFPFSLRSRRY